MILSSSRSESSPTKAKDTELYRQLPEASDLISNYIKPDQRRLIMKAFITSQFGYCPHEIFYIDNQPHYNLRCCPEFQTINIHTVRYGTESLSHLANKIWSLIPIDIKSSPTLESFKEKIKLWQTNKCPCRICKTYIQQIGFI